MLKNTFLKINYQKQNLQKIIKLKTKKCCTFLELCDFEQREVLKYIANKNLDIKVFGYKWFDILSYKFYIYEYSIDKENLYIINKEKKEFDDFALFYNYINGDIYTDTCFYGYIFSNEEILRYNIDKNRLNFDSFIKTTIDDYSYDKLITNKKETNRISSEKTKSMFKWLKQCKIILSYNDLEAMYLKFINKYTFYYAKYVFFSFIIQQQKETIKKPLIEFFYKHNFYDGLSFDDILLNYGKDTSLYVINNFKPKCSYSTKQKRINEFKSKLELYETKKFKFLRNVYFDESIQLYVVINRYNNDFNLYLENKMYFFSFDDMANYLNGDLQNANLLEAPINSKKILKYKVNENTIFPRPSNFFKYKLFKYYENENFYVEQKWFDNYENVILYNRKQIEIFFDFVHFLKNDLSNADLLMCDGIGNINAINNIKFDNIKIKSQDAKKIGINIEKNLDSYIEKRFDITTKNELETREILNLNRIDYEEFDCNVSYVSDIHLSYKFKVYDCKTQNDKEFVVRKISNMITKCSSMINIIAGDTSSDIETFKLFINELLSQSLLNHYFFVLGNHEYWGFINKKYDEIIDVYKNLFISYNSNKIHLIHNNIFYYMNDCWNEISQNELFNIQTFELREKLRGAKVIIFGGTGYAGKNYEFNADAGLYENAMLRTEEIIESDLFLSLYKKITEAVIGMNLIVVTHMPLKDWCGDDNIKDGVIYVNGHTHKNYYYNDENKRIYADNQIGYENKNVKLKKFFINLSYDCFINYKDGIYNISRDDYEKFYAGINEKIIFTRGFKKLYLLKKEGVYMFLLQSTSGKLQILNGGAIKNVDNHDINFFYENLDVYSKLIKNFLSKYNEIQTNIANYIKKIGGDGKIHGCIIDIDYYNHAYINPFDESVIPYFAYSMNDKYVYENLPSLLKYECPKLFSNYEKMLNNESDSNNLIIYKNKYPLVKNKIYVNDTEMYKISRIIKSLQFTSEYSIVRIWNDDFITNFSEDNGRKIVAEIVEQKLKI